MRKLLFSEGLFHWPVQEFMAVKDRYIKNITTLLEQAGQEPNSPEGLRAQQLCREAVVFTFYACFLSPKRLCRASAFDYATREQSTKDDPSVWAAVMVIPGAHCTVCVPPDSFQI